MKPLQDSHNWGFLAIIFLLGIFSLVSACLEPSASSQGKYTTPLVHSPPSVWTPPSTTTTIQKPNAVNLTAQQTPSPASKPYWIHLNPVGSTVKKENIPLTGTTNLPEGTELVIRYDMLAHSCPPPATPDTNERTYCGGSCSTGVESEQTAYVTQGIGGFNTWNSTINTTSWCLEIYGISIEAKNWPNVSSAGVELHFGTNLSRM